MLLVRVAGGALLPVARHEAKVSPDFTGRCCTFGGRGAFLSPVEDHSVVACLTQKARCARERREGHSNHNRAENPRARRGSRISEVDRDTLGEAMRGSRLPRPAGAFSGVAQKNLLGSLQRIFLRGHRNPSGRSFAPANGRSRTRAVRRVGIPGTRSLCAGVTGRRVRPVAVSGRCAEIPGRRQETRMATASAVRRRTLRRSFRMGETEDCPSATG